MGDYPPISDYALIGDCHAAALVARDGSIDWCCMPRIDSGSSFGRLLDRERGGFCSVAPVEPDGPPSREYADDSMVLRTTLTSAEGQALLTDLFVVDPRSPGRSRGQLLRIVDGLRGTVDLDVRISPRFDYGASSPWMRRLGVHRFAAIGGDDGLGVQCDAALELEGEHDLSARTTVHAGERLRLSLAYVDASTLDRDPPAAASPEELDRRVKGTLAFWRRWAERIHADGPDAAGVTRSALVLKALSNARTGALAAAATTSLPEARTGGRTWDYRYSWIRDSVFSVRALAEVGCVEEADDFRRFIHRSAAGNAEEMRVLYGVGGEQRLVETEVAEMEGWDRIGPVRVGNAATGQEQHDTYGEMLVLTHRWHERGHSPDDDLWRFVRGLVERAAERWELPDRGLWEWRPGPRHFTHSKVMCWAALDRGIRLAEDCDRKAPLTRWRRVRDDIRRAVETKGYDGRRGVFTQTFGRRDVDAALLLLPGVGFVDWADERMVRTMDAVREDLGDRRLIRRYAVDDGLKGREGAFLACSFWLTECLARAGRIGDAREVFDGALAAANDLGLFSEEFDTRRGMMMGNVPQALSHLAHITAALALADAGGSAA
jgi:GH15 family glucan-1,4-alpha-glucosidase